MSNPRISVLSDEFTAKRAQLDALDKIAADEARDLSEQERADYDANVTRMEAIGLEIEDVKKRDERFDAVAKVTASIQPAYTRDRSPVAIVDVPSMGQQIKTRALHSLGKADEDYELLQRTLAHGTSADGTSPVTIEGDLIKYVDANRYAVNASRRLPMPDNKAASFKRPRWNVSTSVASQASQGAVLSSTAPTTATDTVSKATYGGTISLSEQEVDWTEPQMLALAVQDLAQQYAIVTDDVLCTAIETASTASVQTVCSLTAASDVFIKAIAAAAGIAYGTSKQLPDTLFVAVDRWTYMLGLTDGNGRPLFPVSGQSVNSPGANANGVTGFTGFSILGLNVVVDPNFTTNLITVAVSSLVEFYEQDKGLLQIAAPSTLETTIAYRGYVATNVYANGFGAIETS